ncbi:MFS transporter [Acidicapsa acidisoli]|uniref:MFS transporter n=1 Tax=Acidicapsa acidisoli TaxID=1615681 RepID=UPI0021E07542|nr:MFS transporter [Acidicapsa acidisoli]
MDSKSGRSPGASPARGLAAFASRDFRRYQTARMAVIIGAEAQTVAVAWQVYSITHRALDLGYTGLALFLPGLFFLLPAGHVADRYDRRQIILLCYSLQIVCTSALLAIAVLGLRDVRLIYSVLFLIGTGRSFSGPASSALIPHLVPEGHFVNAVTWGAAIFQLANIGGPALGGILFTLPLSHWMGGVLAGAGVVYIATLCSLVTFLVLIGSLSVRLGRMEHRDISLKVVFAGFQYVRRSPILLGSFSLDLFVVLLGGATALMPIFAQEILHTGPKGLGMLRAAPAMGALAVSLTLARFPLRNKAGLRLFIGVGLFGLATIGFGLARNLSLSLMALAIAGAADMVSVVIRSSVLQLATPPEMRGRVSAVNSMFLGASNELGEFESGVTAQWLGAVRATVAGGVGALMVTGLWAVLFPQLRDADELTAKALRQDLRSEGGEKLLSATSD